MLKKTLCVMMLAGLVQAREGSVGNGGGAWVCQNNDQLQSIRWARLVDLYEAEKEFGLPMKVFEAFDYRQIVDLQKAKLFSVNKKLYEALFPYFDDIERNLREVDGDLEVIDDALYRMKPSARDCSGGKVKYTQLANYTHYGSILVNEHLFNSSKLAEVDKAALMFHEAMYAYLRDRYGDSDSVRAREIVGYVFSNLKNIEISEKIDEVLGYMSGSTVGMEFVTIPAGSFTMGSPKYEFGRNRDEKQRYVTITRDFEMMTTEVTQSMYFEVMGVNPSHFKDPEHCPSSFETRVSHTTGATETLCPNNPVERVSYNDVQSFISLLKVRTGIKYRLPTEAEWEYAARAGSETAYSFGEDAAYISAHAINYINSGDRTHEVAPIRSYVNLANAFGLYDMHGNVREWTQDWYTKSPRDTVDPVGPSAGVSRVVRGGSWTHKAMFLRSAARIDYRPSFMDNHVGFRLVRTLH
ncbi:MAG: hypothetical protein CME64_04765 [Halobacteriovoraceae bacterium]|nr:hypothetical protein [Halobacteriovoraceae bacterium]